MADSTARSSSLLTWLFDPLAPTRDHAEERYRFTGGARSWGLPLLFGLALLAVSAVGLAIGEAHRFFFSYLVGWTFCLSIALGGLFFVMVHHITKAYWSVVVRRLAEALTWSFPVLAILSLPILFGMHDLFHWTHTELYDPTGPDYDPILAGKRGYLNTPFFIARLAIYFVIWTVLAWLLYVRSIRHDVAPSAETSKKLRTASGWGIPVFGVTLAFASFDLLMSLDPHWFSTIFGVYFFAGSFFGATAFLALMARVLQRNGGMLTKTITKEHYHDLGKWMFAMTAFWAYIAFSQYMLIWYGAIPEETVWYRHRLEHGWEWHTYALIAFHFALPFLILLPRATKRSLPLLSIMAVWFLFIHWFDLHWLALPVEAHHGGFHWLDFTCWLGLVGVFVGLYLFRLSRHSLVPQRDAYLAQSLHFENA